LFCAIHYDRKEIFDLLLECKNTDVNYKNYFGNSPLMFSCLYIKSHNEYRDYYTTKLLAHKNIKMNQLNGEGLSLLFMVILEKCLHYLLPSLLNHPDIDLEMKDKDGGTPYGFARSLALLENDVAYAHAANAILNAARKKFNKNNF
jgi:ankyrin repeat protein